MKVRENIKKHIRSELKRIIKNCLLRKRVTDEITINKLENLKTGEQVRLVDDTKYNPPKGSNGGEYGFRIIVEKVAYETYRIYASWSTCDFSCWDPWNGFCNHDDEREYQYKYSLLELFELLYDATHGYWVIDEE